jgi:hypothetical protein
MQTYKSLFTFGCSYTEFSWPTWADLIAYDLKIPFQNWGRSGAGNEYIFIKMLECDILNNFTKDDLILVNWTSWYREDRIGKFGNWKLHGNVFNNPNYDKNFLKNHHSVHNDMVKNSSWIIAANKMYDINFQSHMIDYVSEAEYPNLPTYNKIKMYNHLLSAMPEKIIFDTLSNSKFDNMSNDKHPDILCHLEHAKKIYNYLGIEMSRETDEYAHLSQDKIKTFFKSEKLINYNNLLTKIKKVLPEWKPTKYPH